VTSPEIAYYQKEKQILDMCMAKLPYSNQRDISTIGWENGIWVNIRGAEFLWDSATTENRRIIVRKGMRRYIKGQEFSLIFLIKSGHLYDSIQFLYMSGQQAPEWGVTAQGQFQESILTDLGLCQFRGHAC
jgi:hypothetical protein